MVALGEALRLGGSALGTVGGVLLFVEFFQWPSYVEYDRGRDTWTLHVNPDDAEEYTWVGRAGALCVAAGFALLFVATFLG
ncbi:MAG: hypothetical protein ABEJ61_07510 [Haloferacaceae archaeon]